MERYRYRAYVLNKDNSIRQGIDLYCEDDASARLLAEQMVDGHAIELWRGDRKVTLLRPESKPFPVSGLSNETDPGASRAGRCG